MRETRTIDGGLSPQQEQEMEEALSRREQVDYECFVMLNKSLPYVDVSDPKIKDAVKEAGQLIDRRDEAIHAVVIAFTGRRWMALPR
jgi:hypothetical protein